MKRSPLLLAVAAIGAVVLVVAISSLAPKPADTGLLKPDDVQVTALGRQVYATHCAACHGAKLEGQPDWRQRDAQGCPRRSNFDPPCRLNFDPGLVAGIA
jgi:mono/diheme cytochrome c family protein